MTNSQAGTCESWLVRCSSRSPGFSRSNGHATRAFSLLTRGVELATRTFELVTRGFELVTRGFELVTRGFELVTRGFELVTHNSCFTFPCLIIVLNYWSLFSLFHVDAFASFFSFCFRVCSSLWFLNFLIQLSWYRS